VSVAGSKSGLRYSPNAITCAEVNRDMMQVGKVRTRPRLVTSLCHTDVNTSRAKSRVFRLYFPRILFRPSHPMASKDDNLSFVLNAIQDVSFQQRSVPKDRKLLQNASPAFDLSRVSRRS